MRGPGILWGFAPLIVYAVFAGSSAGQAKIALLAALVAAVVAGYHDLPKGRVMAWANLAIFGLPLAALGLFGQAWIISWMNVLVYADLAVVAFGSVLARRPFTLQDAREMVPKEIQEHPGFLTANRFMTLAWGAVFAINLGLSSAAVMGPPGTKGRSCSSPSSCSRPGSRSRSGTRPMSGSGRERWGTGAVRASDSVPGYPGPGRTAHLYRPSSNHPPWTSDHRHPM